MNENKFFAAPPAVDNSGSAGDPEKKDEGQTALSGPDKEPTAEELKTYKKMSDEEWKERSAKIAEETEDIKAETDRRMKEWEEKWNKKANAIKAVKPTGDLKKDAEALLEATEKNPDSLKSPHKEAFQDEDEEGILKYLKYLKDIQINALSGTDNIPDCIREYNSVLTDKLGSIISANEKEK